MFSFLFILLQVTTEAASSGSIAPGTSTANSLIWLLAATGLAIVAGGAWVLVRAGREAR